MDGVYVDVVLCIFEGGRFGYVVDGLFGGVIGKGIDDICDVGDRWYVDDRFVIVFDYGFIDMFEI